LDGSNSTYRAFEPGEPDEAVSCIVVEVDSDLKMEDQDCDGTKKSICKKANGKFIIVL